MTATSPPRPPRLGDPIDREALEALVEALFEEARQRARRRRRIYAASVALVALVVIAVSMVVDRTTQPDTASPAVAAPSSGLAGTATPKIAFIREPLHTGYAGVLWVMNHDGSRQRLLADASGGMRWSPDGQKIAFTARSGKSSDVFVMNADGTGKQRLTSDPRWESGLAWSPDGQRIAFDRGVGDNTEIYTMNADGSDQRRLTSEAWGGDLAWSPLGNKIAFVSRRDGNAEIYVMNADGSGQRNLTRNTAGDRNPVWSPEGRRIAFESNWQIDVMNADGSPAPRQLTWNVGRNFAPAWSPDGQKIAFERRLGRKKYGPCSRCGKASTFEVHVVNADGSGQQRLTTRGAEPVWSRDGQKIAFARRGAGGNSEIYTMKADGSQQRNLTRTPNRHEGGPVWSPGKKP
jgi:Tol biopolymer transport system component